MNHLGIKKIVALLAFVISTSLFAKSPRLKVNESFFHRCSDKSNVCRVIMKLDHRAFASIADKQMSFDLFHGAIKVFQTRNYKVKKLRRTSNPNIVVAVLHVAGDWELSEANKQSVVASRQKLDVRYIQRTYLTAEQKRWMNFDYDAYKQSAARYERSAPRQAEIPAPVNNYRQAPAKQPEYREVGYQRAYNDRAVQPSYDNRPVESSQRVQVKPLPVQRRAHEYERKPLPANTKNDSSWVEEEDVIFED